MRSYEIASPLSHLVLQKQRRDPQVVLTPRNEPTQIRQSRLDLDQLFRADEVLRREEIPTWAWHGRRSQR